MQAYSQISQVRGVEWSEPETEVSTSKGRVLCARNIPTSFPYSRLVDLFNGLSDGQVRTTKSQWTISQLHQTRWRLWWELAPWRWSHFSPARRPCWSGRGVQDLWLPDLFYKFVFPSLMNTTDQILLAQVDEWHAPAAPRRRVDRGYIPPSPNHLSSSWSHPNL